MLQSIAVRRCISVRFIAAATLLGVTACRDSVPAPTGLQSVPVGGSVALVAEQETPSQLAVAQAVSGFGGYFIDESGAPTVYLTDASQRPAAEQALSGFLSSFGWSAADLQVRQSQYDYLQLDAWYSAARPAALTALGAVFGDIDEAHNRLTFGGLDASALASIASAVANAGVPTDAVSLQLSGPVSNLATLRDRHRPPVGGLQIQFFPSPVSPLVLLCTLGFNAIDGTDTSFVTNSHCSNVQGGTTTPTDYYQATRGGVLADPANYIAREVEDPDYQLGTIDGPCPIGRRCRISDASRAKYSAGSPFTLGKIANAAVLNTTVSEDTSLLHINATAPQLSIVAEQGLSIIGQTLNKTGRTTGWTAGPVVATCVDVNITASEITQLCQDFVAAFDAGGDSGSPVWGANTDGTVFLAGILWGSSTNLQTGEVQWIITPLDNIKREIGDIKTFDPPAVKKKRTKKVK